jgi:hypothetical protein
VHHRFQLFLAIRQIKHRRSNPVSPGTNGFCGHFPRTVKEGFFQIAFRRKAVVFGDP